MKNAAETRNLQKSFGENPAVRHASFTLTPGCFMALLGPSGCGKTTMLRLIAGLEEPDGGEIFLQGKMVSGNGVFVPPNHRGVGMVFQEYALFPHMNVEKNIAYGLSGNPRERVTELLQLVGLRGLEKRYPGELSGGQQQRVALARALAPQPHTLLLDEPFSNLDTGLRVQVREEVKHIIAETGVSVILVTHDQEEALSMADQVGVMLDGTLIQVDSPRALYENPISRDVALFLGEANTLPGEAYGETVSTALGDLPLRQSLNGRVDVFIRPENLLINSTGIPASVTHSSYFGSRQTMWAALADGATLKISTQARDTYRSGDTVHLTVTGQVIAFPAG